MTSPDLERPLVLASASPRRRRLLGEIGLDFVTRPAEIDETPVPGEPPEAYVERMARTKAKTGGRSGELVLGADTVVVLDDEILGKPNDELEAGAMLQRLSGREHRVLTAVALCDVDGGRQAIRVAEAGVRLLALSGEVIRWYVTTGEPMDKAGSYALQGIGGLFVDGITGSPSCVIGLPMATTRALFDDLGIDLLSRLRPSAGEGAR